MEHIEEEHSFTASRSVVCPVCRRATKGLVAHLAHHLHLLSGYASCASSSSQPSTSRATCHSADWGRPRACSEISFCTTAEAEDEGEGHGSSVVGTLAEAESVISATETKSVDGSEAATEAALSVAELSLGTPTAGQPPTLGAAEPSPAPREARRAGGAAAASIAAERSMPATGLDAGVEERERGRPAAHAGWYGAEQRTAFVRQLLLSAFDLDRPAYERWPLR